MVLRCPNESCREELTGLRSDVIQHQAVVCPRCGRTVRFTEASIAEYRRAPHDYRGLKDRPATAREALVAAAHIDP